MILRAFQNKHIVLIILFLVFLSACGSNDSTNHEPGKTSTSQSSGEVTNPEDSQELSKPTIKILPLGDSITQGGAGYASYRRDLWFLLKDADYNVDFIGSQDNFHDDVSAKLKDFDLDHEGHWAWEAGEINAKLESWLANYKADIVLLHAGTNDFDRGRSNERTMKNLKSIIDKLRNNNPAVVILMAKIIPMQNKDTRLINESIETLAEVENTKQSPVIIVDQYEGYAPLTDNHDNYHPNTLGENKMARKWFNSLVPLLEKP